MKFTEILALVVLLGCSAAVAHADGDPTVKVNKFPDPSCPPADGADYTCFSSNSVDDPLMIPTDNVVANYVWDSTDALTDLYVEFAFTRVTVTVARRTYSSILCGVASRLR